MPFANGCRMILLGQKGRKDPLFGIESFTPITSCINPDSLRVAPYHQASPSWGTDMPRCISLCKGNSLLGESVHIGCRNFIAVVGVQADICVALIVGENDYNIRLRGTECDTCDHKHTKGQHQPKKNNSCHFFFHNPLTINIILFIIITFGRLH